DDVHPELRVLDLAQRFDDFFSRGHGASLAPAWALAGAPAAPGSCPREPGPGDSPSLSAWLSGNRERPDARTASGGRDPSAPAPAPAEACGGGSPSGSCAPAALWRDRDPSV